MTTSAEATPTESEELDSTDQPPKDAQESKPTDKPPETLASGTPDATKDEATTNISALPLRVSVELGYFSIDLAKKSGLKKGEILNLQTDSPGMVKLMFQGSEVARGELVSVEGRLAVRIAKRWGS